LLIPSETPNVTVAHKLVDPHGAAFGRFGSSLCSGRPAPFVLVLVLDSLALPIRE
jgi:hypothetical protein